MNTQNESPVAVAVEPYHCGRPKKSGEPCRQTSWYGPCNIHMTDLDRLWLKDLRAYGNRRFAEGLTEGRSSVASEIEAERLEAIRRASRRTHDSAGNQIVVCGAYAYVWVGRSALRVGDSVVTPANAEYGYPEQTVKITALGTDYQGTLLPLVGRG